MKVSVTAADIVTGVAKHRCECPVARALKRAFKAERVDASFCRLTVDGRRYATPDAVETFMRRFDERSAVEPFEFELRDQGEP